MKIVHTSDWHLGVSLEHAPRHEEHRRFLGWLRDHLAKSEADALLVAGDVFHYTQPSAAAQRDLYGFLAACNDIPTLKDVVVIAGNHDSPSRLEAPKQLLTALNIHVVGEFDTIEETVVPLHNAAGEVGAFVSAIPYLTESKLGVSTTQKKTMTIREEFVENFTKTYDQSLTVGRSIYGDVPAIAMGHMTCADPDEEFDVGDFRTPIHLFRTIRGLPTTIFEGFQYGALGHIHRHHRVGESLAWYSGSPVPINVIEARTDRFVIDVDLSEKKPTIKPVRLPCWRNVFELTGYEDELIDMLETLSWEGDLAPYLYLERILDKPTRAGVDRFQNFITQNFSEPRPRIVGFKKRLADGVVIEKTSDAEKKPKLEELGPEDIFKMMFLQKFETEPDPQTLNAFRSLLSGEADA